MLKTKSAQQGWGPALVSLLSKAAGFHSVGRIPPLIQQLSVDFARCDFTLSAEFVKAPWGQSIRFKVLAVVEGAWCQTAAEVGISGRFPTLMVSCTIVLSGLQCPDISPETRPSGSTASGGRHMGQEETWCQAQEVTEEESGEVATRAVKLSVCHAPHLIHIIGCN